jgi:hypothetical protein
MKNDKKYYKKNMATINYHIFIKQLQILKNIFNHLHDN